MQDIHVFVSTADILAYQNIVKKKKKKENLFLIELEKKQIKVWILKLITDLCHAKAKHRQLQNFDGENEHKNYTYNFSSFHLNCVDKFNKITKEGPIYVCIICSRYLYTRNRLGFKAGRINMDVPEVVVVHLRVSVFGIIF